jgi:hypothetical protein
VLKTILTYTLPYALHLIFTTALLWNLTQSRLSIIHFTATYFLPPPPPPPPPPIIIIIIIIIINREEH